MLHALGKLFSLYLIYYASDCSHPSKEYNVSSYFFLIYFVLIMDNMTSNSILILYLQNFFKANACKNISCVAHLVLICFFKRFQNYINLLYITY